jgi:hypothetical protein
MAARAELARKVARMWEEQLEDPREAADAWRRVLRMKPGDPEATHGLERAKSNMLKKPEPGAEREAYAPPQLQSSPQMPPSPDPSAPGVATPVPPMAEATSQAEPLTEAMAAEHGSPLPLPGDEDITVSAPGELSARAELERLAAAQRGEVPLGDVDEVSLARENHAEHANTESPGAEPSLTDGPIEAAATADEDDLAEDVIIADDLAEMIEVDTVDSVDNVDDVDPSATLIAAAPDMAASLEASAEKKAPVEKSDKPEKSEKKKKRKGSVPPPAPRGG